MLISLCKWPCKWRAVSALAVPRIRTVIKCGVESKAVRIRCLSCLEEAETWGGLGWAGVGVGPHPSICASSPCPRLFPAHGLCSHPHFTLHLEWPLLPTPAPQQCARIHAKMSEKTLRFRGERKVVHGGIRNKEWLYLERPVSFPGKKKPLWTIWGLQGPGIGLFPRRSWPAMKPLP